MVRIHSTLTIISMNDGKGQPLKVEEGSYFWVCHWGRCELPGATGEGRLWRRLARRDGWQLQRQQRRWRSLPPPRRGQWRVHDQG